MSVHPGVDTELQPVLDALRVAFPPSMRPSDIASARTMVEAMPMTDEALARGGQVAFEERRIPGPAGAPEITVLLCRPAGVTTALPGVVHLHGGGMVMGNRRVGLEILLDWILDVGMVVVSPEYRLAPEHPHPAPVEDCYATLSWTAEHAEELGIDPHQLLVAGGSAGGGLAASVALLARDRGGPALAGQVLMYPMLDDRNTTPSSHELVGEAVWDRISNETGWSALLGDRRGGADVSPYAAAARATDLAGLPPAFIDVGSVETFRDEDVDYAVRIWQAGGDAELHVWPGAFHGFDLLAPGTALATAARAARLVWLRRLLA
ncbi:MAG: Alpha/beta hydrolase fold-3 domain protein [Frankiales bacterium]|nr:Alpha/beta hydrolase fold-3 domain protein [Frankiales bacterium]